ncbi:helix-turn-helix domain-containing protein [Pseudonocardia sp. ICBG1122]|nr:helix-turn-helix domain-containing protein [Pseudonocardia pini]
MNDRPGDDVTSLLAGLDVPMVLHAHDDPQVALTDLVDRDDLPPGWPLLPDGARRWVLLQAREATDAIVAANADTPDLRTEEITRAGTDLLTRFLLELDGHVPQRGLSSIQNEVVIDAATRGIPFERIIASLRLAQALWTDAVLAELQRRERLADIRSVLRIMVTRVDDIVDATVKVYLRERERLLTSAEARRKALVEALLEGREISPDEVRTHLGLEVEHHHLAMVLHGPDASAEPPDLLRTAATVARAVGAQSTVLRQPRPDTVWLWASHPRRLDAEATRSLSEALQARGQRLAIGSVRSGADGFRRSHREAVLVDSGPTGHTTASPVTTYRDAGLVAILGQDVEHARWFVQEWLGPLARRDAQLAELRETLAVYYESNLSLVATAIPLHVHRNTVVYRLRRLESLLGRPAAEQVGPTRCALLLTAHYGDVVLSDDALT